MAAKRKTRSKSTSTEEKKMSTAKKADAPGCGLDVGTMNLVSARAENGKVVTRPMRDAFLDLEPEAKRALKMSEVDYIEMDDQIVVIGDAALKMANLFKQEARRPLSRGVISAGELDAQEILSILIQKVVGDPRVEGEHCFYSVPAEPVDNPGQDIIYHTEVFRQILEDHGYTAHPTNEAMAIVYSQCAAEKFSGLAVSYGSGMCNIALSYQANPGMEFSLARGGDWIDQNSARAVGKTASQMCAIKEKGIDLMKPQGRDQQAVALYIRNLISYSLKQISAEFKKVAAEVELDAPIPFVVSGGTSKAGGFMELFEQEFNKVKKKFPVQISEIRQARDPLTAVAEGMLVLAQEEHEEEG
jgi:hypothetical protein